MGNAVASHWDSIASVVLDDHITVRKWYNSSGWDYDSRDATVYGSVRREVGNVYVHGYLACAKGDNTLEVDTYNTGSWDYYSGAHDNVTNGYIYSGSPTVFLNGSPLARQGDTVRTHSGEHTTIAGGSNNVFAG